MGEGPSVTILILIPERYIPSVQSNPLKLIKCYIIEDNVDNRSLNNMIYLRLNLIDGYISSYCSIINSHDQLDINRQANKLASVQVDIDYD